MRRTRCTPMTAQITAQRLDEDRRRPDRGPCRTHIDEARKNQNIERQLEELGFLIGLQHPRWGTRSSWARCSNGDRLQRRDRSPVEPFPRRGLSVERLLTSSPRVTSIASSLLLAPLRMLRFLAGRCSSINRRLAAIAFADVAGFSRLIATNEVETLRRWKALRTEIMEPRTTAAGRPRRRDCGRRAPGRVLERR